MRKAPNTILSIAVAAVVATALFMTANAHISAPVSAHSTQASLPTVKLGYYEQNKGKLAKTLDPALVTSALAADTIMMVNDGLVVVGVDNKVHLHLADKYTVSKNHKVYKFHVRPNARYANGHHVTAADVKFSILRSLAPSTASEVATTYMGEIVGANAYNAGKASSVSGVKVLPGNWLQVTLDKPYAYFLKTFTYQTSWPLDPKVVSGKTAAATGNYLTNNCPGNQGAGPFKFVCSGTGFYPSGQTPSYTMVPNPYYWGKKPTIKIVMPAYNDLDTGYRAYLAGQIDTTGIPTGFISQWKKNKAQYLEYATSRVYYITPNSHMAPFTDVHCRLAVAYAIDRNKIVKSILHNAHKAIYDVVPPGFLGYYSGKDNPHFSLKKAKAEFAKCGSKSTPVKLAYATGSSDIDNEFATINGELRDAGFNSTTNALSPNDWLGVVSQSLDKSSTQIVYNGWQQDYPDPQDYVTLLLRCGEDYDIGGYCNNKFNSLVDKADLEGNAKKRAQLYIQAQHLAISQGAWITLTTLIGHALHRPWLHGLRGTVAYANLQPNNFDWSKVTVSKH